MRNATKINTAPKKVNEAKSVKKRPPVPFDLAKYIHDLAMKANFKVRASVEDNTTLDAKVSKHYVDEVRALLLTKKDKKQFVYVTKLCWIYKFFGKQIKIKEYTKGTLSNTREL